jgi:hypothetical protein
MTSAGIALANNQIIIAVLIDSSVHIHRVRDLNEAKEILSTAKPDIVGMDISSANIYEEMHYSFNAVKVARLPDSERSAMLKKLTLLNIIKENDVPAIIAACEARQKE